MNLHLQDFLDKARSRAARQSMPIRPRIFQDDSEAVLPVEPDVSANEPDTPKDSPGSVYTPCETLFLRLTREKRGVFQLHKAGFPIILLAT